MMNNCNDNDHGEIVHEGRHCPACERIKELEKLIQASAETEDGLNDRIQDLESAIDDLQAEIDQKKEVANG